MKSTGLMINNLPSTPPSKGYFIILPVLGGMGGVVSLLGYLHWQSHLLIPGKLVLLSAAPLELILLLLKKYLQPYKREEFLYFRKTDFKYPKTRAWLFYPPVRIGTSKA